MPRKMHICGRLKRVVLEILGLSLELTSVSTSTLWVSINRTDLADTVPGTELWGGFTQYDLKHRDDVFNAYLNFTAHTEDDSPDQNIVALFYDTGPGFAIRSILTNNEGVANKSVFDEYLSIPNIGSTLTSGPESEIIPQFTGPTPLGL